MNEIPRIFSLHGVRYQVTDVARAAAFYTDRLGFKLEHQQLPAFASVSLGDFVLLLSGPGASGSRPMPGGESQWPGGWNRVVVRGGSAGADRRAEERGGEVSQSHGGWSGRPTDPGRRSRREPNRALRASSIHGQSFMTQGTHRRLLLTVLASRPRRARSLAWVPASSRMSRAVLIAVGQDFKREAQV